MKIPSKIDKININENEIVIKDKFTVILGKFKKDTIEQFQKFNIFDVIEDYKIIPTNSFVEIFKNQDNKFNILDKSLKMLNYLSSYKEISMYNSNIINDYTSTVKSMTLILEYHKLVKDKHDLLKELEISKIKNEKSDLAAKSNLLNKLTEALIKNRNRLKDFEEDYFRERNKIKQITETIENYQNTIQNLNKKKKESFNQLNKLTREMDGSTGASTKGKIPEISNESNLSYSDRMQALRKQAKESQNEIRKLNEKINQARENLQVYNPKFEILEKNHNTLTETIKNDKNKLNKLKGELNERLKEEKPEVYDKLDLNKIDVIRPIVEIEQKIKDIENDLASIENSTDYLNLKDPNDISKVKRSLLEIEKNLSSKGEKTTISLNQNTIIQSIDSFRDFELLISKLEKQINSFIKEINISTQFEFIISENNTDLSIQITFNKPKTKEIVNFDSLTTPEKIFFLISFFISIKLQSTSDTILFSNLIIPRIYNKRGSIFRTIRKILPIFENENHLKSKKLIFIISNLEMKDQINNLTVINIKMDDKNAK